MYMRPSSKDRLYWSWTCDCGFNDNRNTDEMCRSCGTRISCEAAGGHHFQSESQSEFCDRGTCKNPYRKEM